MDRVMLLQIIQTLRISTFHSVAMDSTARQGSLKTLRIALCCVFRNCRNAMQKHTNAENRNPCRTEDMPKQMCVPRFLFKLLHPFHSTSPPFTDLCVRFLNVHPVYHFYFKFVITLSSGSMTEIRIIPVKTERTAVRTGSIIPTAFWIL